MTSKHIDVSLILPCYNEASLFRRSVSDIAAVLDVLQLRTEIIFVDDGSKDSTKKLIAEVVRSNSHFRALYQLKNQGRGKAVRDGIFAARGAVVGYMDIDCEVSPVYIPKMVAMIRSGLADVVIGKRYYRTTIGSIVREVLSRGYQWLAHTMIDTGGLDTESGYKFFDRKKIVPILRKTEHTGWFWDTEVIVRSRKAGLRVLEIPVLFLRRFDKKSSLNIIPDTVDYMVHLWRFRNEMNV